MKHERIILEASGMVAAVTLLALAVCGASVFPELPWNDSSMLGASILLDSGPGIFFTVELLHLMVLGFFVFTLPRVFGFHALFFAFVGLVLWFDLTDAWGVISQGLFVLMGAAVLFPMALGMYLRDWAELSRQGQGWHGHHGHEEEPLSRH